MFDWNSFLTILGLCIAFGGAVFINKAFPNMVTKRIQKQTIHVNYVPDHIDRFGNVVMRKE